MTSFNEVYGYFLNSITDYTYLELQPDDLENELLMLLQKALGKLRRIKFDINLDNKTFKDILTSREINIIALAMVIEYIRPKIVSVEIMKQRLNIKDWQIFSNSQHLKELQSILTETEKEFSYELQLYSLDKYMDNKDKNS